MLTRRHANFGALAAALAGGAPARAQGLDKTVRMIVGFAAGGGTDVSARLFGERLIGAYAPVVIVENRVGAAARVAVADVKNSPADGSVILFTPDFPVTLYPHVFKKLSYDPVADLTPVAPVTKSVLVVSVGPAVPADVKDIKGFIAWCRANPSLATFATTGAGGTPHFVGVMLANAAGIKIASVHYRGGGPALQDLLGGHVAASVNPGSEAIPQAKGGQIRMLGVASPVRSRFLPDVPTLREQGLNVAIDTWTGVFLPGGAPAPVVARLSGALEKIIKAPDFIQTQANLGNEMTFQSPRDFAVTVRESIEKWGPVVKASGFEPEE